MQVFGYVRVSTAEQANSGLSLDTQRRQIEGWAARSKVGTWRPYSSRPACPGRCRSPIGRKAGAC
jgi:DNA invertase Pin-like site-specific DNA recombinase